MDRFGQRHRPPPPWLGHAVTAAAVLVVAAVGGCATDTSHATPTSTTVPPTVAPDRLDSLFVSVADINTVMDTVNMRLTATKDVPANAPTTPVQPPNSDPCLAAVNSGEVAVYQGSGYTQITGQAIEGQGQSVTQDVVSFPSVELALAFVKNSIPKWQTCAGQTITIHGLNGPARWTFGDLVGDVPRIVIPRSMVGGGDSCQHVLSAASNLVVDVVACGDHISDQADQIADKIAANATH